MRDLREVEELVVVGYRHLVRLAVVFALGERTRRVLSVGSHLDVAIQVVAAQLPPEVALLPATQIC